MIKKHNILVAEDNDSNYLLLKIILKEHNLIRAINGLEAVEIATKECFDLIFMDIRMPIMDGIEAIKRIREFDVVTPIVTITANAFDSDKVLALEAGSNDFLTKPVSKSQILSTITKFLE